MLFGIFVAMSKSNRCYINHGVLSTIKPVCACVEGAFEIITSGDIGCHANNYATRVFAHRGQAPQTNWHKKRAKVGSLAVVL